MPRGYYEVPEEQACQSRNHQGNRRHIAEGARVDPCERCGKWTCTTCEGTTLFSEVCDACWRPTLTEKPPPGWRDFWHVLEVRKDFEQRDTRSCRATCGRHGWSFSRHASGYWCAEKHEPLRTLVDGTVTVDKVRISAPTAVELCKLVKDCSAAMEGPLPAPPTPPAPAEPPAEELPEANPADVVELPAELPPNVVVLREHPTLGLEVRLGQAGSTPAAPAAAAPPEPRPLWPGSRLTYERLGLFLEWEPMEAPAEEAPAHLAHAMVAEARSRDMARCPVEEQLLAPQPGGRRAPPQYGMCTRCGWAHALPPPPAERVAPPQRAARARRRAAS